MMKRSIVGLDSERFKHGGKHVKRYKTHSEPFIYDIKKLLKALSDKKVVAQSEVNAFMENCAKR